MIRLALSKLQGWLRGSILRGPSMTIGGCILLSACAHKPAQLVPNPAPPAVKVKVPIAVPCKVEKVNPTPLETSKGLTGDIFEDVKRVLADRETLLADRGRLVAANSDPCRAHPQ